MGTLKNVTGFIGYLQIHILIGSGIQDHKNIDTAYISCECITLDRKEIVGKLKGQRMVEEGKETTINWNQRIGCKVEGGVGLRFRIYVKANLGRREVIGDCFTDLNKHFKQSEFELVQHQFAIHPH